INLFATSLKDNGRAALVMANSASDARHSEADIRRQLIEQNLIYGMLTLPSNLFYTVTLPATLWFFDKGKAARGLDERILFIDARNVFTQIDRAHREFSDAQLQNLATISRLYCGQRERFVALIGDYFADGMQRLATNAEAAPAVTDQVAALIDDADCARAADALRAQWNACATLQDAWRAYRKAGKVSDADIDAHNARQRRLAEPFAAFFTELHDKQKALDKAIRGWERAEAEKHDGRRRPDRDMKALKTALDTLHADMRDAEQCFAHIEWLQSRFPEARYEDVVGLCKAATRAEIKEQDWSLNPGRYVGVVIEEDGKTEEEFLNDLAELQAALDNLTKEANELTSTIAGNTRALID
ncbi:MAG: N-6 DNA methylase, partial [Xanthomonadales bacterium]|nr:N-6 DNA methylase [Xanthomonadales bacterium]